MHACASWGKTELQREETRSERMQNPQIKPDKTPEMEQDRFRKACNGMKIKVREAQVTTAWVSEQQGNRRESVGQWQARLRTYSHISTLMQCRAVGRKRTSDKKCSWLTSRKNLPFQHQNKFVTNTEVSDVSGIQLFVAVCTRPSFPALHLTLLQTISKCCMHTLHVCVCMPRHPAFSHTHLGSRLLRSFIGPTMYSCIGWPLGWGTPPPRKCCAVTPNFCEYLLLYTIFVTIPSTWKLIEGRIK